MTLDAITPKKTLAERIFGPRTIFVIFAGAGALHLIKPEPWMEAVPPQLPSPRELVLISGVAEIVGGVLYLNKGTRKIGSLYLIALLIAVFPANIYMATEEKFHAMVPGGKWSLIARLPLQFLGMWWIDRLTKRTLAR